MIIYHNNGIINKIYNLEGLTYHKIVTGNFSKSKIMKQFDSNGMEIL